MKRLRIILNSKYFYLILLVLILINFLNTSTKTHINLNNKTYTGIITNLKIKDDLLTLEVKGKEKIIGYYYFKDKKDIHFKLGDKVLLSGKLSLPTNNTVFNLFNYKKYLKSKKIYVLMNIDSIKVLSKNNNIIFHIRNTFHNHISKYKSREYLETFILGNKSMLDEDIINTYQKNGILHLLSISGMHISFLGLIIGIVLKKFNVTDTKTSIITSIFLILYMLIVGLTASISRSVFMFLLLSLNKIFKLNLSIIKVFLLTVFTLLFINPLFIYDIGFIYSIIISFYLILFRKNITGNYFKKIFLISLISFLVSLPITLNNYFEINFLSIILNILYVPLVSLIIFPLSLITFIIPIFDNIYFIIISIFEKISFYTSNFDYFMIYGKTTLLFNIFYYLLITAFLFSNRKIFLYTIILLLIIHSNGNILFPKRYVSYIDVNQGDSILIHSNNKTTLIDTGGVVSFNNKKKKSLVKTKTIPFLKSLGIRSISSLIISHGDFDHCGEAINLVNNFKVEKVVFNCGDFNDLEKELVKVLDKKKIKYYSCIDKLDDLYFLQTKEYNNENDNSNVVYTELDDYKFIFMGDASTTTEKEMLSKYDLSDIDVLKIGHHGSKTSSGKEFIDKINPKYSIISVGKNNRYGHPNKEVLENLNDSKIYRTDEDGSIMFKIENNKLKIDTCSP